MPQSVPNLFDVSLISKPQPATPAAKGPAPVEGQDFREALGRAKDRSKPSRSDEDPKSEKSDKPDRKKQSKSSRSTGKSNQAQESQGKVPKPKGAAAPKDGSAAEDDAGGQNGQNDSGQPRDKNKDKSTAESDPSALQSAAVVQIQPEAVARTAAAPTKPAQASASDAKDSSQNASNGRARPVEAQAADANPKGDSAAKADGQQGDPTGDPQPAAEPVDQVLGNKRPELAIKAPRKQDAPVSNDPSNPDPAAAAADLAQLVLASVDSAAGPQSAAPTAVDAKATAKITSATDATAPQSILPQTNSAKPSGTAFRIASGPDAAPPAPPEAQFAQANHAAIVGAIGGQLLPNGGSMHIRLDPPELGAMNVRVEMRDGVMTAAFETTTDQATKLLSHSLGDLKSALEAQGVSVQKLHVRQSSEHQQGGGEDRSGSRQQDSAAQRDQQRREMLRRMWRRLTNGQDPLDLVA